MEVLVGVVFLLVVPIVVIHGLIKRRKFARSQGSFWTTAYVDADPVAAERDFLKRMGDRAHALPPIGDFQRRGSNARFTYIDVDGVVTDRTVTDWVSSGDYIDAYCLRRRAERRFRKDRISNWRG